jgi:hypothetical protein
VQLRIPTPEKMKYYLEQSYLENIALICVSVFAVCFAAMLLPPSMFRVSQEVDDLIVQVLIWSGISGSLLIMLQDSAMTLSQVYHSDKSTRGIRIRIHVGVIFALLPTVAMVACMAMFSIKPPFKAVGWLLLFTSFTVLTPWYFCLGWKMFGGLTRVISRLRKSPPFEKTEG